MYEGTIHGYLRSIESHMDKCVFRDFALWALVRCSLYRERFAQINAITQLGRMTTLLLSPLVEDEQWNRCVHAASIMNAWQVHEVFSDNLAIGLGTSFDGDNSEQHERRNLLRAFNAEMLHALSDSEIPEPATLTENFHRLRTDISIFNQSLIADKHRALASAFTMDPVEMQRLEHCIAPILTANILSCLEVPKNIQSDAIRRLTKKWLTHRYSSVNALLDTPALDHEALVRHGSRTILVAPTLGYYVDMFIPESISDDFVEGVLEKALHAAATIVRLLNDLGTQLLIATTTERRRALQQSLMDGPQEAKTLQELLPTRRHVMLTRLIKDARFAEFNIGLYGILQSPLTHEILEDLITRIDAYADDYSKNWRILNDLGPKIDEGTGSTRCKDTILSFAQFHKDLYAHPHDDSLGEYAI
jgi:hypothetical protein